MPKPTAPKPRKSTAASLAAKAKEPRTSPTKPAAVPNRSADGTAGRRRPDGQVERGYRQTPADEIEPTNTTLGGTRQGERAELAYPRGHIAG